MGSAKGSAAMLALRLYQMARNDDVRIGLRLCELMIGQYLMPAPHGLLFSLHFQAFPWAKPAVLLTFSGLPMGLSATLFQVCSGARSRHPSKSFVRCWFASFRPLCRNGGKECACPPRSVPPLLHGPF